MALLARLRAQALSWWQNIPLPATDPSTSPIFQSWHEFDQTSNQWCPVQLPRGTAKPQSGQNIPQLLHLVTWNVDSPSPLAGPRIEAILSHILDLSPAPDIIFLQEVGRTANSRILDDSRLQCGWFLSDTDGAIPPGQSFTSMTLLSKARFQQSDETKVSAYLGPVWGVKYSSRFGRDALCCDVFVPSSSLRLTSRIRLINVHLDSLQIQPSRRPQQISIVNSYLRSAGRCSPSGECTRDCDPG